MMKKNLLAYSGFLFAAIFVWSVIVYTTTNDVGYAQTNSSKDLSNFMTNTANIYNSNSKSLGINSNLAMQNEPIYKSCDVELDESPAKTSPSYNLKGSTTGKVVLDDRTRKSLNGWFSIFTGGLLEPFAEGKANDRQLISFAINRVFGFGREGNLIEEAKKETPRCKQSEDTCELLIDEKEIERIVDKYFQLPVKKHGLFERPVTYRNSCYYCEDCCADGEMAFNFAVVEKIISVKGGFYLVDVKNYQGLYSLYSECNDDCDRKRLQAIKNADAVGDFETIIRLCPQWEPTPLEKMRAKIKIVKSGTESRPVLVSYEKIESYSNK